MTDWDLSTCGVISCNKKSTKAFELVGLPFVYCNEHYKEVVGEFTAHWERSKMMVEEWEKHPEQRQRAIRLGWLKAIQKEKNEVDSLMKTSR